MELLFSVSVLMVFLCFSAEGFAPLSSLPGRTRFSPSFNKKLYSTVQFEANLRDHKVVLDIQEDIQKSAGKIPSLTTIKETAKRTERTRSSKVFCQKTGGYPSKDIQNSLYSYLWEHQQHKSKVDKIRKIQKKAKKTSKDDMITFGLM
jgi:hypothetical protein